MIINKKKTFSKILARFVILSTSLISTTIRAGYQECYCSLTTPVYIPETDGTVTIYSGFWGRHSCVDNGKTAGGMVANGQKCGFTLDGIYREGRISRCSPCSNAIMS